MLLLPQGPGIATARALRKLACLTLAVLLPVGMALAATDTLQIERGRYLARIANCAACHTSEGGKPFAGGLPIRTAVGTIHSTNITPDAGSEISEVSRSVTSGHGSTCGVSDRRR